VRAGLPVILPEERLFSVEEVIKTDFLLLPIHFHDNTQAVLDTVANYVQMNGSRNILTSSRGVPLVSRPAVLPLNVANKPEARIFLRVRRKLEALWPLCLVWTSCPQYIGHNTSLIHANMPRRSI
jgi:hypothetical protein